MIIGFTGTREGATTEQIDTLKFVLSSISTTYTIQLGLHGGAKGADAQFWDVLLDKKIEFDEYSAYPSKDSFSAGKLNRKIHKPKLPLSRNKDIVNDSNIMIAMPFQPEEQFRGGTWSTIRYCRKISHPLYVIYPDGSYTEENIESIL